MFFREVTKMKHYRTCLATVEQWAEAPCEITEKKRAEVITVDPEDTKQTILGFGGAFTEASAYNLKRVGKEVRTRAIRAYFDPVEGLAYSLGRISVHGCDFSLGSYLYIKDRDDRLKTFDISRDQPIIDLIHDAEKYAFKKIKILASPWTPPFWMKDNNSPIRGGHLLPEYYQKWAKYLVRFVKEYRAKDVSVEMMTVQNEPAALQRWDSCLYTAEEERNYVKVLGLALEKARLKDVKLLVWDHNRDLMVERVKPIYEDPVANKYVWGTAFHWYDNEQFQNVAKHYELYPEKHLLFTEGCQENGPHFGEIAVGERYGRNMINDLRNRTEGYIDWSLFLDETGGPNHVNNLCSAPIMIRIFSEELIKMPSYYYIGHFSRFIQPGAVQIGSSGTNKLLYVAFQNPDGRQILVLMNEKDESLNLEVRGMREKIRMAVQPHSISTLVI
jgi:glucosylceramidase